MSEEVLDCNCPWTGCPAHKGSLCSGKSEPYTCPHCEEPHYYGDPILGKGMHLCKDCLSHCGDTVIGGMADILSTMTVTVPKEFQSLWAIVRRYWMARCSANEPWETMMLDLEGALHLLCLMSASEDFDKESSVTKLALRLTEPKAEAIKDFFAAYHNALEPEKSKHL